MSDALIPELEELDQPMLSQRLRTLLNEKTMPMGAMGQLEGLAIQLGLILGTETPRLEQPQLLVCAADHGLAAQGVSPFASEVTGQMVRNILNGGAAVNMLAHQHDLALTVVDCGVAAPLAPHPQLLERRLGDGCADSSLGPAMSAEQCRRAIANGREIMRDLPGNAVLLGTMGIGNNSVAALLLARLTGQDVDACVVNTSGLDTMGRVHQRGVLRSVLALHARAKAPLEVLAALGGFEIATLVGVALQAAQERRVIVLDGYIATSAVLVAHALQPTVVQRCVATYQSAAPGHTLMLRTLGLQPLLQLDLRLGEGSGAALVWPLLVSACRILCEMASFDSAGVSRPIHPVRRV